MTSPDTTKLGAIRQLYARWLSGDLPTEDMLFELGPLLKTPRPPRSSQPRTVARVM